MTAVAERERRADMLRQLRNDGLGPYAPSRLRQLGIYGGAAGTWVDKANTATTTGTATGVTVSVLHTGEHYPDDLSESGLIYHYPETNRPLSRDQNEVDATKAAKHLALPLFVLLPSHENEDLRDLRVGWVDDWDDTAKEFLIIFSETPPVEIEAPRQESPFTLRDAELPQRRASARVRPNQQRFRFDVLKAYGPQCAVCSVRRVDLLIAAHICPKKDNGTDDWRNGVVLCGTHHAAFDLGLFGFDSAAHGLLLKAGCTKADLGITADVLQTKGAMPHPEALRHHAEAWRLP